MVTSSEIRTSRVYVNPGVSICNLVSYKRNIRAHTLFERKDNSSPSGSL